MRALIGCFVAAILTSCSPAPPLEGLGGAGQAQRKVAVDTAVVAVASMRGSSSADFVPAAPAAEEGGECELLPLGDVAPDEALVILSFPDRESSVRNIGLAFSASGELLRYNDLRGNLRQAKTGPRTSIIIDFAQNSAIAMNEWPDRPGQATLGSPSEFLASASLGHPQRMIELVKTRCGIPRPAA